MAGRPFKYNAKQIEDLWLKYLEFMKTQYVLKPELIKSGERAGEQVDIKIRKPLTIISFCHFIDISTVQYFNHINGEYKDNEPELFNIFTRVHESIRDEQISGATVNVYNGAIVARLNGLNETINVESNTQPVINISLPGIGSNFTQLKESNPIDIEYQEVKAIELTDLNE